MKRLTLIAALLSLLLGCTPTIPAESGSTTAPKNIATEASATTSPLETTAVPLKPEEVILASMTLEEKVGQLFLARCPDINALEDIKSYALGGFILFSRDFEGSSPRLMSENIVEYQEASQIPMLIAVDEEGGSVCRISSNPAFRENRFSSPRKLFAKGGIEAVLLEEEEKCILLRELGINVNMAPVCDIATDPNAFMHDRSLGQSPQVTSQYVSEVVSLMHSQSIGSVLKHFPGYGNNADTHTGVAIDERTLEELESIDLVPFASGIEAGCDAILVSHTFVNAMDQTLPASLSPAVLSYLRDKMRFSGVIVTDDLDMQAITEQYGVEESAILAVLAGNDLLCTGNYAKQHRAILDAVSSGRISMAQIDNSVIRILRWKIKLGLISSATDCIQNFP